MNGNDVEFDIRKDDILHHKNNKNLALINGKVCDISSLKKLNENDLKFVALIKRDGNELTFNILSSNVVHFEDFSVIDNLKCCTGKFFETYKENQFSFANYKIKEEMFCEIPF